MNIKNCRRCGKMFNVVGDEMICPDCKRALEDDFQRVKKFVQDNKTATIPEIVEECKVEQKQIKQWIREERLQFSDESPIKISCEICGTQIATGRFCDKCKKESANNLGNSIKKPEEPKIEPAKNSQHGVIMHTFK